MKAPPPPLRTSILPSTKHLLLDRFYFFGNSKQHLFIVNISSDVLVEWMAENSVLSVALEGNIDQVQYTDRIKSIVGK